MADNDIFRQELPHAFTKAYKVAKNDGSPQEFVEQLRWGLAQLLKERGCPGFDGFCDCLKLGSTSKGQLGLLADHGSFSEALRQSELIARNYAGTADSLLAQIGARVCESIALEAQAGGEIVGEPTDIFAQRFCVELPNALLIDRLDQSKVMERFMAESNDDPVEAVRGFRSWIEQVKEIWPEHVRKIARQLAGDPSGNSVRSQQVRLPQRPTKELIDKILRLPGEFNERK